MSLLFEIDERIRNTPIDHENNLFVIDFATGKNQKMMSSVEYRDIEARIGNYLYLRHGKEGYCISLNPPA